MAPIWFQNATLHGTIFLTRYDFLVKNFRQVVDKRRGKCRKDQKRGEKRDESKAHYFN